MLWPTLEGTMVIRSVYSALLWLAFAGFALQGFCARLPVGQWLCIGCDRDGSTSWAISEPCVQGTRDCCDHQTEDLSPRRLSATIPTSVATGDSEHCGCIDVPLPGGATIASAPSRSGLGVATFLERNAPIASPKAHLSNSGIPCSGVWARAGPTPWSAPSARLLTPRARWTVLTI